MTGIIGGSIMVGAILWNQYSFSALFLLITIMSMREFYAWCKKDHLAPQVLPGIISGAVVFICFSFFMDFLPPGILLLLLPLVYSIFIRELYTNSEKPFQNIAITILGIVYLAVPMALINLISQSAFNSDYSGYHPHIVLGYFFLVWASDIGAYFVGKNFGKMKLFERISPNKTWEGSIGGMLSGLLVAWLLSMNFADLRLVDWICISIIVVVTGTLGDLVESLFKRSIHIKDSGHVLPGHGGFLDRFDAIFISAPFVFVYLQLMH